MESCLFVLGLLWCIIFEKRLLEVLCMEMSHGRKAMWGHCWLKPCVCDTLIHQWHSYTSMNCVCVGGPDLSITDSPFLLYFLIVFYFLSLHRPLWHLSHLTPPTLCLCVFIHFVELCLFLKLPLFKGCESGFVKTSQRRARTLLTP